MSLAKAWLVLSRNRLFPRTQAFNRGTRAEQFYVIANMRHPAVLVEGGFLTNNDDVAKLASEEYREKLATAICEGIAHYRDVVAMAAPRLRWRHRKADDSMPLSSKTIMSRALLAATFSFLAFVSVARADDAIANAQQALKNRDFIMARLPGVKMQILLRQSGVIKFGTA